MKVVIATMLILIVFFSGAIYLHYHIRISSEILAAHIEKVERAIEEEDWVKAKDYMDELNMDWDRIRKTWLAFIEHLETDKIDVTIAKVERYINIKEDTLSLIEIVQLKKLVEHIFNREKLELTNIL